MKIYAVVVIYNINCAGSPTCQALRRMDDPELTVLIYDNSTRDFGNLVDCQELGWRYMGGDGNVGLSKAYNRCIDFLTEQGAEGFLCLFDDDTDITPAYFTALREAASSGGALFAPLVMSNGRLLSPCRINGCYQTALFPDEKAAFAYAGDDMTAINSGMAAALSVFDDYRYDENIFLDGVDHTFVKDMAARGIRLRLLNYHCQHQFSGDEKPPKAAALIRFQIYAKDHAYIFRNQKASYWYLVGKRAAHLTLQYRSLSFFQVLTQYAGLFTKGR